MNWTIDKTISITLAVWAVAAGLLGVAFQTFGAVAWHWLAFILWLGLALVALLMQADTERRAYLSATLRHRRYTQVYLYLARRLNTWLWHRLGQMEPRSDGTLRPPPETAPLWQLMRMALTWRVLNFALLLAVAYPVLALLRPWLLGGDAVLGAGIVVFPASPFWPDRAVVLGQLVILTSGFLGRHLARSNARRFWRNAADWLPMFALASAFAFASTFAAEYAFAGGYAVAFAFAFSYAFTGAYAFGYAVVIAGAFALAGAFSGEGAGALSLVFALAFTLTLGFLWETSRVALSSTCCFGGRLAWQSSCALSTQAP